MAKTWGLSQFLQLPMVEHCDLTGISTGVEGNKSSKGSGAAARNYPIMNLNFQACRSSPFRNRKKFHTAGLLCQINLPEKRLPASGCARLQR
jgi:hypothetical protein